ncbi:hypothetical protein LBMAG24_21310 [Bacteroidota bacterium]|nr:DUF1572 family protein [Bacteroidota bacterium]GDX46803.1 hypothetical protein LBMAG24_21310 [Bacteroidota bacterium]
MENNRELAKRFSDVILNNSWVANNSYKNQLIDLPLEVVLFKYQSLHSIAALTQHVHYYIAGILNVFNGGNLDIKDIYSFDFPPIHTIEQWHTFLAVFWTDAASFTQKLEEMDENTLNSIFVKKEYGTYHFNINTLIEHSYYHLGQIVLIKKLIS